MSADDRADQIRARLAAAEPDAMMLYGEDLTRHIRACGELDRNAPADLAFLLAERTELLRRVEQAKVRTQEREQKAYETGQRDGAAAERHGRKEEVEQAQRAGAVKALRKIGRAWRGAYFSGAASDAILQHADQVESGSVDL